MSLYNMLHGVNPISPILLEWLDIDQPDGNFDSGRFRDIHLNEDGTKVILYTRNGGGNRDEYQPLIDHFADAHPNYLRDYDDDFDSTYAYIEFSVPDEFKKLAKAMATGKKPKTVHEAFEDTMKEMDGMTPDQLRADPRFKSTVELFDKISDNLKEKDR